MGDLDGNTSGGYFDIFVVKYNSSGVKQWTQQLGTSGEDFGEDIAIDSNGNLYVTGKAARNLDDNSNSNSNIFVVKYNGSGVKQWTQQIGTASNEAGYGITSDSNDNVYVTGSTGGGLDGNISGGNNDFFVIKYDSSGNKQWTKQLGTSGADPGYDITSDSTGNVYITGQTGGGLDGNASAGGYDLFVVKYNSAGTKQWTKQLGTTGQDVGRGISTDSSGNIYITGDTLGGLAGNSSNGASDILLIKYDSNGNLQ